MCTSSQACIWPQKACQPVELRGQGYTSGTVKVATAFIVEPMRIEHIPAVSAIEKLSFPQPWPQNAYRREITENRMAHYVVARRLGDPAVPDQLTGNPSVQSASSG